MKYRDIVTEKNDVRGSFKSFDLSQFDSPKGGGDPDPAGIGSNGGNAGKAGIQVQLRKASNLDGKYNVEFLNGENIKVDRNTAIKVLSKIDNMRTSQEKFKAIKYIEKSYKNLLKFAELKEGYAQPAAPKGQLKGKEKMPKAKGGRKDHPHGGRLVGEGQVDEAAPIVAAAIWVIKFAAKRGAWPVLKWLMRRHAGKIIGGGAAAYYIDQGWDWVVSQIGEEYAQMLIDNKFEIGMAVALILGAVALKKFLERKGEALAQKFQGATEDQIHEMTSAGAVGAVAMPMGTMQRRVPKKKKKNR